MAIDVRPVPTTAPDLASELLDVISPIRRVLRRTLRRAHPEQALPQAQIEVLGVAERRPGTCVQDAAQALQLAPNSVSTLVNELARLGLIHRQRDPADRRAVRLWVTADGAEVLASRRAFRRDATGRALAGLDAADRQRIEDALPAFRRLLAGLEAEQEAGAGRAQQEAGR